ncbi:MAG TPA: glycoside hydrolase family 2 TIM barrel-domain containing protein [Fimbriimonadaceae bacterium]|nr:glycoside hydrolase family 2 TIM barrel-domain containing protein [Fimbriimonadaceae bacterium]
MRSILLILALCLTGLAPAQLPHDGVLTLGGFNCIDLRPYRNDNYLDLYRTGYWSYASFRMDVWKRLGTPYWYAQGAGDIRVAGSQYHGPASDVVSAASNGAAARANSQQPANGAISFANDGDPYSYWYAGENHPSGKLWIEFKKPQRVKEVRFLGWAEPRHAPKDYSVGLILADGSRREIAAVRDEKRRGEWISFPVKPTIASGIYLDVRTTMEGVHGPVIYEFQARGDLRPGGESFPSQVEIPLHGLTAKDVCFLGNVGGGFPDARRGMEVGEYVLSYANGKQEIVPLIAGVNVAPTLYGNFVPEAQFAWGLRDQDAILDASKGKLFYHLGDLAEVEPKRQLMVFDYSPKHGDWPLAKLTFRCTSPRAYLILEGLTLLSKGEKMNALFYNGKRLDPTPASAPPASPSWRDAAVKPSITSDEGPRKARNHANGSAAGRAGQSGAGSPHSLSADGILLDGVWRYRTDPGDQGMREGWYGLAENRADWRRMPVPSQWYAQGLDYHGVVWFARTFPVRASFPGQAIDLHFDRVDYDARVWINGIYVGRHKGAYSSFRLDATKAIRKGRENLIVVRVDSPLDPGYEGFKTIVKGNAMNDISMPYAEEGSMGGIYRSVWLYGRGEATADDIWAQSEVSDDLKQATVHVRMNVRTEGPVKVICRLIEPGGKDLEGRDERPEGKDERPSGKDERPEGKDKRQKTRDHQLGSLVSPSPVSSEEKDERQKTKDRQLGSLVSPSLVSRQGSLVSPSPVSSPFVSQSLVSLQGPVEFTFHIDNPKLWWPWEQGPQNLHTLVVELWQNGRLSDRLVSRVGIKQVERDPKLNCIMINHHRMFLKGMLNDDVHWESLMDRRGYQYRIELQKRANFNVIRMITHESSPEFYELCDEMGMLVWQEMPLQWSYSSSAAVRRDILPIVAETIKQTRPHACVIGYSAWNEGGQYGFTDEITKMISSLDPSRPISRASGGGDWDIHVYPTQTASLTRRTPLWTGYRFGYISETGAYGIEDLAHLHEMFGDDLFKFGGAEYFWETFASYRHVDGWPYVPNPPPVEWPVDKIKSFVFSRVDASERYFWQAIKSMYETTRAQRFDPSTSCIYCRFDDPMPTAFLGVVNFIGKPLKAYYGGQEACQPVLPILMLDFQGASDVRVVNDYWFRSWKNCRLSYVLKTREGKIVAHVERGFDLPVDSVTKVIDRADLGDIWHVPGGFIAELTVRDASGKTLSFNHYDFTAQEVHDFVTSAYPVAPVQPLDSIVAFPSISGLVTAVAADGCYGPALTTAAQPNSVIGFDFDIPEGFGSTAWRESPLGAADYAIRVACDSGPNLHQWTLYVDGAKAEPEKYDWLSMNEPISRGSYANGRLAWYPGWWAKLGAGRHRIELKWEGKEAPPKLTVDAIAVQPR